MKKVNKTIDVSPFEAIRKWDESGKEYWSAGALARLLGYSGRKDFTAVIEKAQTSCHISGLPKEDHFLVVPGLQELANGKKRKYTDLHLSRYACYLCIMNADPSNEAVAMGQAYIAAHTYLVEVQKQIAFQKLKAEEEKRAFLRSELSRHNINLAGLAKRAGVLVPEDFAIFQNHGYKGLYGGLDVKAIAARKGLAKGESLLDHMGSAELAANLFRVNLAEEILREGQVKGVSGAAKAHFRAGKQVRRAIKQLGGTSPEQLPAADRIATHERKKPPVKKENYPDTE